MGKGWSVGECTQEPGRPHHNDKLCEIRNPKSEILIGIYFEFGASNFEFSSDGNGCACESCAADYVVRDGACVACWIISKKYIFKIFVFSKNLNFKYNLLSARSLSVAGRPRALSRNIRETTYTSAKIYVILSLRCT